MTGQIPELIASNQIAEAVTLAMEFPVPKILEVLTEDVLEQHPESSSEFVQQWVKTLPPAVQLQAAVPVASLYVLAFAHLPEAYRIGADILLRAQRSAADYLADSLEDFEYLTDGPDAYYPRRLAVRLRDGARLIRELNLEP